MKKLTLIFCLMASIAFADRWVNLDTQSWLGYRPTYLNGASNPTDAMLYDAGWRILATADEAAPVATGYQRDVVTFSQHPTEAHRATMVVTDNPIPPTQFQYGIEVSGKVTTGAELSAIVTASRMVIAPLIVAEELTDSEIADVTALFAEWAYPETVAINDLRRYEGPLYKCIQGHDTQEAWTPPNVPALWAQVAAPGTIAEWVQPYGGSGTYEAGSVVTWGGSTWSNTVAAPTLNVWEPGVYGWVEL